MNQDQAESMLILTKLKNLRAPVSRRLKTWNPEVFTERCPFGCEQIDGEEHSLFCRYTAIIRNVKDQVIKNISRLEIKKQITTFWTDQNWSAFDIIMQD